MLRSADGLRSTITGCLLLGGPVHAGSAPIQRVTLESTRVAAEVSRRADGPGFVSVWSDREEPYQRGDKARIYLRTDRPAYLTVVRVDTDGRLRILFPLDPGGGTRVAGPRTFEVTRPPNGRSFRVDDYPGIGYLLAIASSSPFNYDDIARGDHWDYRAIGYGRLQGDPYVALAGFAASISRGEYQYDIAPYYVERRYEYPRFVCYDCHSYARYDEWDPYAAECSRFRVVIYDDPGYYPFRYNQGRNVVVSRPSASRAQVCLQGRKAGPGVCHPAAWVGGTPSPRTGPRSYQLRRGRSRRGSRPRIVAPTCRPRAPAHAGGPTRAAESSECRRTRAPATEARAQVKPSARAIRSATMKLWRLCSMLAAAPLAAQSSGAPVEAVATITPLDVMRRVAIIADDSMMGRDTPSRGLELTAEYVASEFRRAGLRPAGDSGGYIQRFGLSRWVVDTAGSAVKLTTHRSHATARLGIDARYIDGPIPDGPIRGDVVLLAGASEAGDVRERIVLLVADFSGPVPATLNQQVLDLAAAGAKAVLVLSNRDSATFAERVRVAATPRFTRDAARRTGAGAPILEVHDRAVAHVVAAAGFDPARLRASGRPERRLVRGLAVEIRLVKKVLTHVRAPNVVGILEGTDPALRHEYLAYSAHIDHIGITPGQPDSINNGADDNASGVAGLLELVEAFTAAGTRPRRSLLFLAPSAEEPGLLGSAHFTEHPTVPMGSIVANINMDLIGRNWPDSVITVGIEQSDLGETLERVVQAHPELRMTPIADRWPEERIFYRSDHYNFARRGVPVLFFTSGTHRDYHRPADQPERINGEKESRLLRLLFYLGADIANRNSRPQWNPESYRQIVDRR